MATVQASSLTVDVEYRSASVDKSSSSKPKTRISGSASDSVKSESSLIGIVGTSGGARGTGITGADAAIVEDSKLDTRDD